MEQIILVFLFVMLLVPVTLVISTMVFGGVEVVGTFFKITPYMKSVLFFIGFSLIFLGSIVLVNL